MKGKFTKYLRAIVVTNLFTYKRFLIIAVLVVATGASGAHLSKKGSDRTWFSVLTRPAYCPNLPYCSIDINYFIPEDDKSKLGMFIEFSDPEFITGLKGISFHIIDTRVDDYIYSFGSLTYISVLGFTPLRSPPHFVCL